MSSFNELVKAFDDYKETDNQVSGVLFLSNLLGEKKIKSFLSVYNAKDANAVQRDLNVPYYWQRDSKTGHGERMCQSSSLAMAISYLYPDLLEDDDDYLSTVFKFGDTVSIAAHAQAMSSIGVSNVFHDDGTEQDLIELLVVVHPPKQLELQKEP